MAVNVRQIKVLLQAMDASRVDRLEIDTPDEKIIISKIAPGTNPQTTGDEAHDA